MDPSLLKQREAFKARALAQPAVEKRRRDVEVDKPAKKAKSNKTTSKHLDHVFLRCHFRVRLDSKGDRALSTT